MAEHKNEIGLPAAQETPEPNESEDPLRQLWHVIRRLPSYIRLAWRLMRDPRLTCREKAPLIAAVTYCVTPLHWPVNAVPVLGQIDTPLALLFSLQYTLNHCSPARARSHLRRLGMHKHQLEEDLSTVTRVATTLPRKAAGELRFAGVLARVAGRRARRKLFGLTHRP
ncbi:MAG TPA: hypothetical protein VFJ58_07345 [Armatimonadota bacterium]|nr:hypothetical protein [Armatimonadota bacterium]